MAKKKNNKKNIAEFSDPLFETPAQAKLSLPKSKAKKLIKTSGDSYPSRVLDRNSAETEIKQAFEDIIQAKNFAANENRLLSEFWQAKEHAPFLEELKIRQLVTLKPADLLDKKSFTEQKLENLLKALEALKNEIS